MKTFRFGLSLAFAATALAGGEAGAAIGWYVMEHRPPPVTLPVGTVAYTGPYSKGGFQVCVEPFDESIPANDMRDGARGVCQVFDVRAVGQCESWWSWASRHPDGPNDQDWRHRWPECSKRTVQS